MTVNNDGRSNSVPKKKKTKTKPKAPAERAAPETNDQSKERRPLRHVKQSTHHQEKAASTDNSVPKKKEKKTKPKAHTERLATETNDQSKERRPLRHVKQSTHHQEKAASIDNNVPKKKKKKTKPKAPAERPAPETKDQSEERRPLRHVNQSTHQKKAASTDNRVPKKKEKKTKPKARTERLAPETNHQSEERRPLRHVKQSTHHQEKAASTDLSSKVGGNSRSRKRERSKFESCLRIAVPVIVLLLCLVAAVVVLRVFVFSRKERNPIPKTPARMVILEVTERKLTPLEINNKEKIFEEGSMLLAKARADNGFVEEVEKSALPGKL